MSESKALGVTIKAPESERFAADNPWLVFEGEGPTIYGNIVQAFGIENPPATLAELVLVAQATFTALAHAVRGGLAQQGSTPPTEPAPQQRQQGWGQTPAAAQQGAAPAQHRGGQRGFQDPPHPEGKTCEHCPNVLVKKKSTGGKQKWQCPDWRWNNGNPTNHTVEWID